MLIVDFENENEFQNILSILENHFSKQILEVLIKTKERFSELSEKNDYINHIVILEPYGINFIYNDFKLEDYEECGKKYCFTFNKINQNEFNENLLIEELRHHKKILDFYVKLSNYLINTKEAIKLIEDLKDEDKFIIQHPLFNGGNKIHFQSFLEYSNYKFHKNPKFTNYILKNHFTPNLNYYGSEFNESLTSKTSLNNYDFTFRKKMFLKGEKNDLKLEFIENKDKVKELILLGSDTLSKLIWGIQAEAMYFNNGKKTVSEICGFLLQEPKTINYLFNDKGKILTKKLFLEIVEEHFGGMDKLLKKSENFIKMMKKTIIKLEMSEERFVEDIDFNKNYISNLRKNIILNMEKELLEVKNSFKNTK